MIRKIYIAILLFSTFVAQVRAQVNFGSISGKVYDLNSGEALVGAVIYDHSNSTGTTTNEVGYYFFKVDKIPATITVSFLGYTSDTFTINRSDVIKNFKLKPANKEIGEVVIRNVPKNPNNTESTFLISKNELLVQPSLAGESDIIQYLQKSPGVSNPGDGNSNLYVRGGGHDQNLFLLDNIPLFHVAHFGGFFSTFNSDIINSAKFYKGGFPARYGGRLSSVLDIYTYDGNLHQLKGSGTVGLLFTKINLNGPILKEKSSFLISFRKNTLPFYKIFSGENLKFNFFDVNAKISTIISDKEKLYASFYTGNDLFGIETGADSTGLSTNKTSWGNLAFSIRYNRIMKPKLFGSFIIGHSKYHYNEYTLAKLDSVFSLDSYYFENDFNSNISCEFAKAHFQYNISNQARFIGGYEMNWYRFNPGYSRIKREYPGVPFIESNLGYESSFSVENNLYGEFVFDGILGFSGNTGIRSSVLSIHGKSFNYLQPRVGLSYALFNNVHLKLSYSKMNQAFHVLTSSGLGFSSDYRIPVLNIAPPSVSSQIVLGFTIERSSSYEIVAEMFTKKLKNLVMLKGGVRYTSAFDSWGKTIETNGEGMVKGLELLLRKTQGKFTGWIGYSLSSAMRRFQHINNGDPFPFDLDRKHELNCFGQYAFPNNISIAATWNFGSGIPANLPSSYYNDVEGNTIFVYKKYNGERLNNYHRLDLDVSFTGNRGKWILSIINAYNRKNIYYYEVTVQDKQPELNEKTLFSIIPTLSYTFNF